MVPSGMIADSKTYRPDIDGLRAVAILLVLCFHAAPDILPGGFVGVDIFFVISGYLISGIILKRLEDNNFSFGWFYFNRIKRIFPALVLVLGVCYLFGFFVMFSYEFINLGKHIAGGLGFVENFVLYKETGYFDEDAVLKPLMHLWSLGVEEQFYLFFPCTLWLLWKSRGGLFWGLAALGAASFLCNAYTLASEPSAAFFLPQNRIWELLLGAMGAYVHVFSSRPVRSVFPFADFSRLQRALLHIKRSPLVQNWKWVELFAVLGCGLIAFSVYKGTPEFVWPAVLGAFALIMSGPFAAVNKWCLSNKAMVAVGLISYPLYLWHWPLFSYMHLLSGEEMTPRMALGLVALSFILATCTYYIVEKPIRFRPSKVKIIGLCCVAFLFLCLGFATFKQKINSYSYFTGVENIVDAAGVDLLEGFHKGFTVSETLYGIPVYKIEGARETLYFGNSYMAQYSPRISEILGTRRDGQRGAILLYSGTCLPIPGFSYEERPCSDLMRAFDAVLEDPAVDEVVITANWFQYLYSYSEVCRKKAQIYGQPMCTEEGFGAAMDSFELFLQGIKSKGKGVRLISSTPFGQKFRLNNIVKRSLWPLGFTVDKNVSYPEQELRQNFAIGVKALQDISLRNNIEFIDPLKFLCPDGVCGAFSPEDELIYAKDGRHLLPDYVRKHVDFLDDSIWGRPQGNSREIKHAESDQIFQQ